MRHYVVMGFSTTQRDTGIVHETKPRMTLMKKDDTGGKSLNESLMSRLRPVYRGSASTLAALTGGDNGVPKKDEGKLWKEIL